MTFIVIFLDSSFIWYGFCVLPSVLFSFVVFFSFEMFSFVPQMAYGMRWGMANKRAMFRAANDPFDFTDAE